MSALALHRLPDWPQRFVAFLEQRESRPFEWGANDCCGFAEADVEALTGAVAVAGGRWAADTAAQRLRLERGLVAAVSARLGPPLASPAYAQRGDIVLVKPAAGRGFRFLAVCDADRWAGPGPEGIDRGPMSQAVMAWRVG
jgi:hypothetical protein